MNKEAGPRRDAAGDIAHRYQITVYALDVPTLALPATTPPAIAMFTTRGHILAYGRITATASARVSGASEQRGFVR